jgi:methylase of polypeptide subunit release factors
MPVNLAAMRQPLRGFDFRKLFVEELGWDHHTARLEILADGQCFRLAGVAEKRGFQAFICEPSSTGRIPDYGTRRKIERQVTKSAHEHLIIFIDAPRTTQVWQWVKRELGKPAACREHTYDKSQPGDALIQKLQSLLVSFEEEEILTLVDVTGRARAGFDIERVTKRFYERFKTEHAAFMRFLKGIPDEEMQRWYISVMLNRLMFIYFIQKKGFLNDDQNYLRTRLAESRDRGKDRFYKDFLCPLFFEGFAKKPQERSQSINKLLGKIPYLNGGLFLRHQIEEAHGKDIQIADAAFEKLFSFFEQYHWHLDERPLRADNEINPDVLGYIFEKYINQKQMGAYYTKEDITGYISQNTVIPFLFDAAQKKCKIAFEGEHSIWRLLQTDPDRYIYPAVRRAVIGADGSVVPETVLPDFVQKGMHDPRARMFDKRYNLGEAIIPDAEGNNLALPTETSREYVERRKRCLELRAKLAAGEVRAINDLITYNLDMRQFAQDVIETSEGPELLRAFYHAIEQMTVLDPACGSGAFLFAALNILEPLYEACLDRMEVFLEELERSGEKHRPEKFSDFRKILERMAQHPNRRYFILKSIILNNLFGVDIMEEATEICKLRLFLKLVAQIEDVTKIEPLPDIDFNIRAGNTLVGYATYADVKRAVSSKLDFAGAMQRIEEKAQDVDRLFALFRQQQTEIGGEVAPKDKQELRERLRVIEDELNDFLAGEYGVKTRNKEAYRRWVDSHKPFHWFIEFYGIMAEGGFDVVIGNPPYVEYRDVVAEYTVRGYQTESCANLYAFASERGLQLLADGNRLGYIIPVSSVCTDAYLPLLRVLTASGPLWVSNFNDRPGRLFEGLEHSRLAIILPTKGKGDSRIFSTKYHRWHTVARPYLFETINYISAADLRREGAVPKLSSPVGGSILSKVLSEARSLAFYCDKQGKHAVYYTRKLSGFVQILDFVPRMYDRNGRSREPSELKAVCFPSEQAGYAFLAVLNSSLFYWLLTLYSDCRNLNKREVYGAPFGFDRASAGTLKELTVLAHQLMSDMKQKSQMLEMHYENHGTMKIQCILPKLSKPIIDEIDRVLAKHYRLTDEELDFIVNYDIKYRMGREAAEEE